MKNIEELLPKNICEISGKTIKITSDEFYNFTINKKFNNIGMLSFEIYDASKRNHQSVINAYQFIKYLNENKVRSINIKASDELIPVYIDVLNRLNYNGKCNISLYIERMNMNEKEYLPLDLDNSKGKIDIPARRLIWQPKLSKLENVIENSTLNQVKMLKRHILSISNDISGQYNIDDLNFYDRILYIYNYINSLNLDGKDSIYISNLISVLLNNPVLKVDAKVITGKVDDSDYSIVGIVNSESDNILECAPITNNPFEKKNIEVDKPEILLSKTQNLDSYLYNHYNIDKDSAKKLTKHFDSLRK